MSWQIEHLGRGHDRTTFECGKLILDSFLARYASQYEKRNLARTYVAVGAGETRVVGYYSLSAAAIRVLDLPESLADKLPEHPVPAALLARLAVDQSVQGQGLGRLLIGDALAQCAQLSEQVGLNVVTVDAIDDEAVRFYERMGFTRFRGQSDKLFIPVSVILSGLPS
jgi:GNAT superfamily N-acetyltransferase